MGKKRIYLKNRTSSVETYLEHHKGNTYKFVSDGGYLRVLYKYDNEIIAIDPDGGPMISVGDTYDFGTISKIYLKQDDGYYVEVS